MQSKITWADKYELALQEELSVKEISLLRTIGQHRALEIRKKAIEYCIINNIAITSKRVPTEAVLIVTGFNIDYYYNKMKLEAEMYNIKSMGVSYVGA